MGRLDLRKQSKSLSRGDTNISTTTIIKTLSQELRLFMGKIREVVARCLEKAVLEAREEDMDTVEATAVGESHQVTITVEVMIRPNHSSLVPISSIQEIFRIYTAARSSFKALTHEWASQESTIKEKLLEDLAL